MGQVVALREVKSINFQIPKEVLVIFPESARCNTPPGMPNLLTTLHLHGSTHGVLAARRSLPGRVAPNLFAQLGTTHMLFSSPATYVSF